MYSVSGWQECAGVIELEVIIIKKALHLHGVLSSYSLFPDFHQLAMAEIDDGTGEGAFGMAWWEDRRGPRVWVCGRGKSHRKVSGKRRP